MGSEREMEMRTVQLNIEGRKEGDVITLTLLDGVSEEELIELLRSEGIRITVGPINAGTARLKILAPKRMLMVIERQG